ncbi:MAG: heparan-alpha-glucosaminide N-acetyltransferase [Desulfonatronovibrionaceae bacterium]
MVRPDDPQAPARIQALDAARGLALVLMMGFHLAYDLDFFKVMHLDMRQDPFWTGFRNFIVGSFILIAGISLKLSMQRPLTFSRHLKRQKWLALSALTVSAATWLVFPDSWIYFGVLHFILTARILCFFLARFQAVNIMAGFICIWIGISFEFSLFNAKWLNWIGFSPVKPVTEDYVPLFPWLGVFLLGMFPGGNIIQQKNLSLRHWLSIPGTRLLTLAGQNSLLIYMFHQPVLMGILYLMVHHV